MATLVMKKSTKIILIVVFSTLALMMITLCSIPFLFTYYISGDRYKDEAIERSQYILEVIREDKIEEYVKKNEIKLQSDNIHPYDYVNNRSKSIVGYDESGANVVAYIKDIRYRINAQNIKSYSINNELSKYDTIAELMPYEEVVYNVLYNDGTTLVLKIAFEGDPDDDNISIEWEE